MNNIIRPGAGILFMKVGTHAQEEIAAIIARKTKEIEDAGFAMWGYGGNTCHPSTMVQPFAEQFEKQGQPIHLCMQRMNSNHFAEPLFAKEYSTDGLTWMAIPKGVQVRGSRFALLVKSLQEMELTLPLSQTKVAVGPNRGRVGSRYIQGQVDKACLVVTEQQEQANEATATDLKINLVAELHRPYAVFLRNDD